MFSTIEQFTQHDLPGIVDGQRHLDALFASYRRIGNNLSGSIATSDPQLNVAVHSGLPNPDIASIVDELLPKLLRVDPPLGSKLNSGVAVYSLKRVMDQVVDSLIRINGTPLVLVAYLGFIAFAESLWHIQKIRRLHPGATIVTLTCDCGMHHKEEYLSPLIEHGVINHSLITSNCGGERAMEEILIDLIVAWSERARSVRGN